MELKFGNYLIRSWKMEDAQMLAKYANNRKIWKNLRDAFPYPYTLDDAKQFITNVITKQPETFFCISTLDEAIGSIGLSLGQDVHRYTAEIGYWLAEPYWNRGIISEAILIFTEYSFKKFEVMRIFAEPYDSNTISSRVLEKAGFRYEGRLNASVYKDGNVLDQLIYAKTKRP